MLLTNPIDMKLKNRFAPLLLCLFISVNLSAQSFTWQRMYGETHIDAAEAVVQLSDGDYVFLGMISAPDNTSQMLLCKTDRVGNSVWQSYIGTNNITYGMSLAIIPNEGFILAGSTSVDSTQQDIYLVKTDLEGQIVWERTFGGLLNDVATSVQPTADGGFILTGYSETVDEQEELFLLKVNANGQTQWQNYFGGVQNERGEQVIVTADGGYAIVGFTESFGTGKKDILLIKTDFIGNEMWLKTYGNTNNNVGYGIVQNSEGGFVITGTNEFSSYYPEDLYLMGVDATGNELWSNSYGGDARNKGFSIAPMEAGGYIVAGSSSPFFGTRPDKFYAVRFSEQGNKVWERTFSNDFPAIARSIQPTLDGGFIIAGLAQKSDDIASQDAQLIKMDELGRIDTTFNVVVDNNSPLSCYGDETGNLDIWVTGGQYPYNYSWNLPDIDTFHLRNLGAAIYEVTVKDQNGQTITQSIEVKTPSELVATTDMLSSVSCPQSIDGVAEVNVSGGTAPYTYRWSNETTTAVDTQLPVGTFQITVTDANDCQTFTEVTINSAVSMVINESIPVAASCTGNNDGSISISASGGMPPFTYRIGNEVSNDSIFNDLASGEYIVYVTDQNGCTINQTVTVGQEAETEPAAAFTHSANDLSVVFSSNLTDANTVTWDYGDGNFSEEFNPQYVYTEGGDYMVCLTAHNGCGSTTVCDQISLISCIDNVLEADFEAVVNDTIVEFVNISTGDEINSFRWKFGDGNTSDEESPIYTYDQTGSYEVCLTARNDCSSYTYCDSIHVEPASSVIISIGGQVYMNDETPISDVTVSCGSTSYTTTFDGNYHMESTARSNCALTPVKDTDPANGVTTADIITIRRHVLAIEPFTSPYQLIAADVNNNGSVTSYDLLLIQRLILNINQEFADVPSWRFVPADYEFMDGSFTDFPESISVNNFTTDQNNLDFIGIKMGDVNRTAVPNFNTPVNTRSNEQEVIIIENKNYQRGDIFTVDLQMPSSSIGHQFALNYDESQLELVEVISNVGQENFSVTANRMVMLWWQTDEVLQPQIKLKLSAKQNGQLQDVLQLLTNDIPAEVYDTDLKTSPLALQFTNSTSMLDVDVSPNPAVENITVHFDSLENSLVTVSLLHSSGGVITTWKNDKQFNHKTFNISDLNNGIYFLIIDNGIEQIVKKIIKIP